MIATTSVPMTHQKPVWLNSHALGRSRVNKMTIPIPNITSPEIISNLMLAVLENKLLGVRAAILMLLSLRYIKMYHAAPSSRYTTRYILSDKGNEYGLRLPSAIAANTMASIRQEVNP